MIVFIKKNKIISFFAFVSIIIVISYAITYSMPDYYGIEGWYSLFNNIAISYIAAVFFYVLQVYLPECQNQKKAQMILKPVFIDLVEFLEYTIACCRKFVVTQDDGKIYINWTNKNDKSLYFIPIKGEVNIHRPAVKKTETDIKNLNDIFKTKIKCIKEKIDFRMCDQSISNALSKIEMSDFYSSTIITALMFESTFIAFPKFQESVNEFEILVDEFKQCCGITDKYDIRNAETIEIASYEAIVEKKALQASTIDEFNEISYREYLKMELEPLIKDEEELNKIINQVCLQVLTKTKKE